MRIVVAGPPKAGNVWLKSILAAIYGLKVLGPRLVPQPPSLELFSDWVKRDGFRDDAIFHQHFNYSEELVDAIEAVPAHLVTIVRDPYDVFVSSYYTLQQHIDDPRRTGRASDLLLGKPLDHPDVLAYLRHGRHGGFHSNMVKAKEWMESGRALVVRYEELHRQPIETMERLTERIAPTSRETIAAAVDACSAENMRKNAKTARHVRTAKVGDSKERLNEEHLAIFRERHADLIRDLGYEVR